MAPIETRSTARDARARRPRRARPPRREPRPDERLRVVVTRCCVDPIRTPVRALAWASQPSRLATGMFPSGGPRAGALIGGRIGSLKEGEDRAHGGRVGAEGDDAHLKRRRAGSEAARLHRCGRAAASLA